MLQINTFFEKPLFQQKKFWIILISLLALITGIHEIILSVGRGEHGSNNYIIFEQVFYHVWNKQKLFIPYPEIYRDVNHYGPLFSIIIAPFALLPTNIGSLLWNIFSHVGLVYAIWQLELTNKQKSLVILITLNLFILSMMHFQSNPLIATLLIFSFVFIRKDKVIWATLMIAIGIFFKIYGIVGLGLFFFSKQKRKFILYLIMWGIILFVFPMLISSPSYILSTYAEWFYELEMKNNNNLLARLQNVSLLGVFYKTTKITSISSLIIFVPAVLLLGSTYLRYNYFNHRIFQINTLALLLISICLFSTSTENPTYIIAVTGVSLWYLVLPKKNLTAKILLISVIVITTFSPSDLFYRPMYDQWFLPYSLHCLPCFFVWLYIIYQQWFSMKPLQE